MTPARARQDAPYGRGDDGFLAGVQQPIVKHRLPRKPDMQLENVLFQFRQAMRLIEKRRRFKFPAQVGIDVDAAKPQTGKGAHQVLRPLRPGVPIGHGVEQQVRAGGWGFARRTPSPTF